MNSLPLKKKKKKRENYFREKEEDALLGKFFVEFQKQCERSHGYHVVQSSQPRSKFKKRFTYQYPNIVQIKPPTAKSQDLLTLPERKTKILKKIREKTLDDLPLLIKPDFFLANKYIKKRRNKYLLVAKKCPRPTTKDPREP